MGTLYPKRVQDSQQIPLRDACEAMASGKDIANVMCGILRHMTGLLNFSLKRSATQQPANYLQISPVGSSPQVSTSFPTNLYLPGSPCARASPTEWSWKSFSAFGWLRSTWGQLLRNHDNVDGVHASCPFSDTSNVISSSRAMSMLFSLYKYARMHAAQMTFFSIS